jgi:predicted NBD/HSP70 family sugar kinase
MYVQPSNLRRVNERRIVRVLFGGRPKSRAQLARRTGLSAVTVGKVVDDLIQAGILEELDSSEAQNDGDGPVMGRPPRLLGMSRDPKLITLEITVEVTRVSLVSLSGYGAGSPVVKFKTPTTLQGFKSALGCANAQFAPSPLVAVLVSVPGVYNEQTGEVLYSPNLHWTEGFGLMEAVHDIWNVPIFGMQEIRALALGHLVRGPNEGSFFLVEFGDGVGGAFVTQGHLQSAPLPLRGELGHTPVLGNDRVCGCGGIGCMETLASRPGLLQTFAEEAHIGDATWLDLLEYLRDRPMPDWLLHTVDAAGSVIAGAINILGANQVVLMGDLIRAHPEVVQRLRIRINQSALWGKFGEVYCESAPRRRAQGLVYMAIDRFFLPETDQAADVRISQIPSADAV